MGRRHGVDQAVRYQAEACPQAEAESSDSAVVPHEDRHQDPVQHEAPPLAPHEAELLNGSVDIRRALFSLVDDIAVSNRAGSCSADSGASSETHSWRLRDRGD